MTNVSFIGGGNMANAIIGGLLKANFTQPENIVVSDPYAPGRQALEAKYSVKTTEDNNATVTKPNTVLILAVKPQVMKQVAEGIADMVLEFKPLIITIAAGITIKDLSRWLTKDASQPPFVVRCMPNTPALVSQGATGLYAPPNISEKQKDDAFQVLSSISKCSYWVDKESLLDVVTGISGSGPAYFFLMVEALEKAGIELGLSPEVARGLASQTCLGAGMMLTTSEDTPAELRRKVTSPKGTTEAAIKSFESDSFASIVTNAVKAATNRGEELGRILGEQVNLF